MDISQNILSDITIHMKYARYVKELKRRETWEEIVERNMNMHIKKYPQLEAEIRENYKFVLDKKVLPSMRSLQFGGKPIEISPNRMFNCCFAPVDSIDTFSEIMFLLLGGSGVGFSVQKHDIEQLPEIRKPNKNKKRRFLIGDSIEGWADTIKVLFKAYFGEQSSMPDFDYSDIRQKGTRLITSGGKAPGPQPLKDCVRNLEAILSAKEDGTKLTPLEAHDCICCIADAVLAGGIRRAALISLFSADDEEMINCKSNVSVINYEYAAIDAGIDNQGQTIKSVVEHISNGKKYFDINIEYVIGGKTDKKTLYWVSEEDIEEHLKKKNSLPWYHFNPQRGRANNSAVLLRHKISKEFFMDLWKKIEDSGCGEPGFYLTNDKTYGTNPCCFVGSTLVATADGRNAVSIKQLCDEGYVGPVYSIFTQLGQTVVSHCSKVWKSRENAELVKVTLDDGSSFICTPEHRIMTRNGQYVEAGRLTPNVSLMPFNSFKREDRNYRMIQGNNGEYVAQYAHVAQYYDIIKEGVASQHIHHIDGNGLNDLPSNLESIDASEHNRMHMLGKNNAVHKMTEDSKKQWMENISKSQTGVLNSNSNGVSSDILLKNCHDKTLLKNSKLTNKEILDACGLKFLSKGRLKEMGAESVNELSENIFSFINHKVLSVEFLDYVEDVYDMTVEGTHNFAIITSNKDDNFIASSGVFVHNCEIGLRPYQFCNLCEVNVSDIISQEDLNQRVKVAAFIGTLQAGYTNFHYLRDIWKKTTEKEALIGVSMTGIASAAVLKCDMSESAKIVVKENKRVAKLIGINEAARTTAIKPAGTTSLTLGTSSGVHAWHNDYYIRRVRVGKNEAIYTYLLINHPELLEDDYFRPNDTAIICVPQKAPENSILRTESPFMLLDRIKKITQEWIKPGHRSGANTHNVSATISLKPEEWNLVGEWMWNNRDFYNGLSVIPYDGGSYIQAPFTDCTKEEYERLFANLTAIDLKDVVELEDETNLSGELACAGGACTIV